MNIDIGVGNMQPSASCIGVDILRPEWAKKFPQRFVMAKATQLPFKDRKFDQIRAKHILEHFSKDLNMMR